MVFHQPVCELRVCIIEKTVDTITNYMYMCLTLLNVKIKEMTYVHNVAFHQAKSHVRNQKVFSEGDQL